MTNRILLAAVLCLAARAQMVEVQPDTVGFSAKRLERLHAVLEQKVEQKQLAGIVTILARHGKIVEFRTYGNKDFDSGVAMDKEAIFRIFSMTKPITGVAMMQLYEQGKWSSDDPVSKFIPEFANLKVDGGAVPLHPPTMAELMSHTAGFTYGYFGNTAIDRMYREASLLDYYNSNLQQFIDKLAKIPLMYQPGARWVYSVSVDIQGYIIEKLSGEPLGTYFRENILQPLGMKDTGFHVDPEKVSRLVPTYVRNATGQMVRSNLSESTKEPSLASGGGGLYSTARDYYRFAQMLANGGQLDGARILAPTSIMLMRTNRLPQSLIDRDEFGIGYFHIKPGFGFGYDFGVFTDPGMIGRTVGPGTFTWEGAAGTWFWVDPANDIVFVGMIQRMPYPDMSTLTQQAVYQALVNPEK